MVIFFFFFNQSFSDCGSGWLWLGWVSGCDVGVVGLWFGFSRKFQFVGVMGGNGGYRLGGGRWWLLVCWVCGFVHGYSSFKERERQGKREMKEKRKNKKITKK